MSRPGRHFTVRLAAIAAAGVALRALYLLTIGRPVTGIGDWWFYHWQANAIADGLGFVDPFWRGSTTSPPVGRPSAALPAAAVGVSRRRRRRDGAPRARPAARRGDDRPRRAARPPRGRRPRRPGGRGDVRGVPADGRRRRRADERDPLRRADRRRAAGRVAAARPARRWIALATGAAIGLAALTRSEALLLVPLLAWPGPSRGGRGRADACGGRGRRLRRGDRAVDDPQPR